MESLSRPPHRRRQSSSNTGAFASFSMKNPYDDMLFSGGGTKARPFGAHEYSEIFAGSSSSIPVLDLPGLDESGVSGECRSSKLDYSNIFGGLKDDDVALSYEELFNGVKKPKRSVDEPGILANARLPVQESEPLQSSRKSKRSSGESADQSVDGVKQQFSLSFNKTSQKSNDLSKGKTHIAQLQAVPGFTYFMDGTQQTQRKEVDRHVPLLKREVSRTWSFSSDVEAIKGKGGSSSDNSHTPDKSCIAPPPSSRPCNIREHNDFEGSRTSSFQTKEDASGKIAALKKAIEQAQESIRIAKMIMERKKECIPDDSKPRLKGRSKLKDNEENRKYIETKNSKEKNAVETHEKLDPIFHAFKDLNGKINAFLGHGDKINVPGKAEMEKVRVNFEAAKEHSGAFNGVSNKSATSCSETEALCDGMKVVMEELVNNVEATEAHERARNSPGVEAEADFRTTNSGYGQLVEKNNLVVSRHDLTSYLEGMGTDKKTLEQKEVVVCYTEGSEKAAELAERAISTSQKTHDLENIVDEASAQVELTNDLIFEMAERPPAISPSTPVRENANDGANSRICQEEEVIDEGQNATEDLGRKHMEITEEREEDNMEHLRLPYLKFDSLMNDLPSIHEKEVMEQEEKEKKCLDVLDHGGSGHRHGKCWDEEENGMRLGEARTSFESKEHLNDEALAELINKSETEAFPETEEVAQPNTVHGPEITEDETLNNLHGERRKMSDALEQNETEGSRMEETIENEVVETKQFEGIKFAEFQKIEVSWGTKDTNILGGAETTAEKQDNPVFQEAACEIDIDAVDAKNNETSTSFSEIDSTPSTIFSETQEPCDIDLDNLLEENNSVAGVPEIFSAIETGKKGKQPCLLEDNDIIRPDSLHRSASEGNFTCSNLHYAFEGLSFDRDNENFGRTNTNNEETLPMDKDISDTTDRNHNPAQETVDKFNMQNLPEFNYSDCRTTKCDLTDVRMVLEQTSASVGRSESTSSLENMDGLSVNESEICAENIKNETSDEEEVKDDLKIASEKIAHVQSEGKYPEEQCDGEHFHVEPEETEKSVEDERMTEAGEIFEKINENSETSTMEENCTKENLTNFNKEDQQQRIEAIKRGRAREKDRIAAERAMREARERAFAEAQVRAERAAVERAAAEARQRFMAETQEKLEKSSTATRLPPNKASTEAKLRSERAAVERATAEARERALEKVMSLKTSTEGRAHADKSTEKSRNNGLKHSFSSSDLEKIDGTNNESAKRSKARLERHQRIMERAAKALAEKNMRDLLAQKEQAERNRLAESLDADIKRWVMGKEGNLRALLSTLQYILGPNSGWQPISLTEIITTPAVKKAYRKATLYVHPDKLQQRGASIQQKYICEKVFDLLKAAWNRFNSEER
ncbi:auxilin-like protein 1 [Dorcoceras hygrometricum]|uniref:Auxilin-like protein 1 n=1 Tax=Dorcoceras hygrometricum TaxID=472368 RepID=A0A2Z7B3A8_9LAMI|nr:auxilin-like protein 1 [Dorcoceras hygrometricum]